MERLTPELARVLTDRITKAIRKARYFPATCADERSVAEEIVRPYLPLSERARVRKLMLKFSAEEAPQHNALNRWRARRWLLGETGVPGFTKS